MNQYPPLYNQLMQYLRRPRQLLQVGEPAQRTASQYSHYSDKRHLITLSWMVMGVLLSQSLHLTEWEAYVMVEHFHFFGRLWSITVRRSDLKFIDW